jgi:hypothetical protein
MSKTLLPGAQVEKILPGKSIVLSKNSMPGVAKLTAAGATTPVTKPTVKLAVKKLPVTTSAPSKPPVATKTLLPGAQVEKILPGKSIVLSTETKEEGFSKAMERHIADLERSANIPPEDLPTTYSSRRAIMSGERKMPVNPAPSSKSKSQKAVKHEIDPALTALIEKARARGKRTSSFLSPEEIPYLIRDSQVHKTVLFLSTSYMFYNYPNTIYYSGYIISAYVIYLCVNRYNKYMA